MYGTRDAASVWGETWWEVLKGGVIKVGVACFALLCRQDGHSKDCAFLRVVRRKQLQIFENVLRKRFEVEQIGHMGFSAENAKKLRILHRTVKINVQKRRGDFGG